MVDDFLLKSPIKIGCCEIHSLGEMVAYTSLSKWVCLLKLRAIHKGKAPYNAFFGLTDDIYPVIVRGEMFLNIGDALKCYAIYWHSAMNYLLSHESITPRVIDRLFLDDSFVQKDSAQMVSYNGDAMSLALLMESIGGKSSIFLSRMKGIESDYKKMSLQQLINKHLLNSGDAVMGE
jgi:hypothetical protein